MQKTKYMFNVIFDFEGVFWDSMEATVWVYMEAKGWDNYEKALEHLREDRWSHSRYNKNRHYTHEQSAEIIAGKRLELDKKLAHGTMYFMDFVNVVRGLQAKYGENLRMAIVSTALKESLTDFAEKFKLEFTHLIGFYPGFSKENEVQKIASDWNVELSEIYFVTDTLRDIRELKVVMSPNKILGCAWGWHGIDYLKRELPEEQILMEPGDLEIFLEF